MEGTRSKAAELRRVIAAAVAGDPCEWRGRVGLSCAARGQRATGDPTRRPPPAHRPTPARRPIDRTIGRPPAVPHRPPTRQSRTTRGSWGRTTQTTAGGSSSPTSGGARSSCRYWRRTMAGRSRLTTSRPSAATCTGRWVGGWVLGAWCAGWVGGNCRSACILYRVHSRRLSGWVDAVLPRPPPPQGNGYTERAMVIYDGLHYDALSLSAFEGAPEQLDVTLLQVRLRPCACRLWVGPAGDAARAIAVVELTLLLRRLHCESRGSRGGAFVSRFTAAAASPFGSSQAPAFVQLVPRLLSTHTPHRGPNRSAALRRRRPPRGPPAWSPPATTRGNSQTVGALGWVGSAG
jgi:hypothetical protein